MTVDNQNVGLRPKRQLPSRANKALGSSSDSSTQLLEILILGELDVVDADLRERP
jgi:hypothetical protein